MNTNPTDLFQLFTRLNWLLHRYHQRNHRHFGPMGDPHRGQGRILALLKLKPEISQKELSDILDMRSQSLGEMLGKLEKSGYITRTPSEADRRVMEIRLTEAGKSVSFQNDQHLDTETLFTSLNEDEQEKLGDYLTRVIQTLEELLGDSNAEFPFPDRPHFDPREFDPRSGMHGGHHGGNDFHGHGQRGMGRPGPDGRGMGRHGFDGRGYGGPGFDSRGMGRGYGRRADWPSQNDSDPGASPNDKNKPEGPEAD